MEWMARYAFRPQATGGTDWTVVGSYNDDIVLPPRSSMRMGAAHKAMYVHHLRPRLAIGNGEYMKKTAMDLSAKVDYWNGGSGWKYGRTEQPWPVRWADRALRTSRW
jgi:hypothetical protein